MLGMLKTARIGLLTAFALFCLPALRADETSDPDASTSVSYTLRFRPASDISRAFAPLVEGHPEVTFVANATDDRVRLSGPPWAHELFEKVLERMDRPNDTASSKANPSQATRTPAPTPPTRSTVEHASAPDNASGDAQTTRPGVNRPGASDTAAGDPAAQGRSRQVIPLPRGRFPAVRAQLDELFATVDRQSSETSAWLLSSPAGELRVECDPQRQDVYIEGTEPHVDQCQRLVRALIRPQSADRPGETQTVLRLDRKAQPGLRTMLSTSRTLPTQRHLTQSQFTQGGGTDRGLVPLRLAAAQQDETESDANDPKRAVLEQDPTDTLPPPSRRRAVPPPPEAQPPGPLPPGAPTADETRDPRGPKPADGAGAAPPQPLPPGDVMLPQLEGIDIETLPDLDAIILRGRNKDIDQLAEIIRQLELLSRQTQPTIEIVPLSHSPSAAIAEVIEETQESLIGTRQGRAQVIPLAKPNALLLIGWGEAVKALKELAEKLDQPVTADTQFLVFRLKHATATAVQEAIETFFDGRDAQLAPQIQSTVDQRTNSLIVHAAPRDLDEISQLVESLDVPQGETVHQTRVFEIRNSLADDIAQTLQDAITGPIGQRGKAMELLVEDGERTGKVVSGILEDINVTVNARKNSLVVSAPADSFPLIEALIRQLDSEGTVAKIKIFPIRNGDAASLVETLRSLIPSQGGPAQPTMQLSNAPGGTALVPLRFTVDVRSNSIIATGSEADLKIVDAVVARLDESDAMQRKNTVYQLKNAPAVDVALAINEFLRNTRQVEEASPGAVNPYQQLEKEVVVVPEPVSNKLVLSATPRYFEEIRSLIEKLDEQPPQVMIQVLIAEVTLGNAEEFGVELGLQDSVLFDRSLLGDLATLTQTTQVSTPAGITTNTNQQIVGATNTPGFDWNNMPLGNSGSDKALAGSRNVGSQGLSNFDVGRTNTELGFGGLVLAASSANVSFLLRALEESRRLQVLSRPQVLTLDNQPAFIQVGQRVPRIVGSTLNQIGQQNQIELENVGLILGVTPRISPEGNVVMEIDAEKSAVGPEDEGIPVSVSVDGTIIRSPRVDVTSAQATVSAADGETIILGGLITDGQREIHRKVPWLGDIPVLKYLFRYDSFIAKRTELLIVLTPRIVRSPEDMERLKQVELTRMNWCAADVVDLHGDVFNGSNWRYDNFDEEPIEIVYPHNDPRGEQILRDEAALYDESLMPPDERMQGDAIMGDDTSLPPEPLPLDNAPPQSVPRSEQSRVLGNPRVIRDEPIGEATIIDERVIGNERVLRDGPIDDEPIDEGPTIERREAIDGRSAPPRENAPGPIRPFASNRQPRADQSSPAAAYDDPGSDVVIIPPPNAEPIPDRRATNGTSSRGPTPNPASPRTGDPAPVGGGLRELIRQEGNR
jgi:type II secretion system protein D